MGNVPSKSVCGASETGSGDAVAALRSGNRRACEAFVEAHYRGVYRFFTWLTGDPEAAADLTQETFAAFWASLADPERAVAPEDSSAASGRALPTNTKAGRRSSPPLREWLRLLL